MSPVGVRGTDWATSGMPRCIGCGLVPSSMLIAFSCCAIWRSSVAIVARLCCTFASARDVEMFVSVPPRNRLRNTSSVRRYVSALSCAMASSRSSSRSRK